ncbi:MAG: DUF1015 domain-containing protein [Dehalococcoidia bacterium]|nr:MAG: DUF1015 domain-containing protein [Dehalococcoidia bacterium]
MAEIHPFRGVHYNQRQVKDLAEVICPPYDVISPQLQQELYQRNEYNFVRLEHNRELPQDTTKDNKYTRSAAVLERWLAQKVLVADETPSIYLHDHYFHHNGREYRRRGIIAGVRLQEWADNVVRPHEGTLAEHTTDRLSLLWVCQANTSPILALFEDKGGRVSALLTKKEKSLPMLSSGEIDGERHNLWAINDPEAINQLGASLSDQPLYIADGHHRYESALTYRRERRAGSSSVSGEEAFNFVMMELVDFADPGLVILPAHRLVRGMSKAALSELAARLQSFFEVEELPVGKADAWGQINGLLSGGDSSEVKLVLLGLVEGRLLQLRLRDFNAADQMMPHFHSELYKRLDVDIVDSVIPHELGRGGESITYSYDGQDAVNRVLSQEYQLAFLLSPVRVEAVKAIADAGDKMSRKATYFYPKAPAGLVLHRLD